MSEGEGQESTRHEEICDRGLSDINVPFVGWGKEVQNNGNAEREVCELSTDLRKSIERDFEVLKCASKVDRSLLYSLLLSQINNSRRLETIMSDFLGIPYESVAVNHVGVGKDGDGAETKGECSSKFLLGIREMFPDADISFLEKECLSLETEEDCTRFINTVMLSGVYPKSHASVAPAGQIVLSSDEEISSTRTGESLPCHRKRRKTREPDLLGEASTSAGNGFTAKVVGPSRSTSASKFANGMNHILGYGHGAGGVGYRLGDSVSVKEPKASPKKVAIFVEDEPEVTTTSAAAVESGDSALQEEDASEEWLAEQTVELIRLFPNTDPSFLRSECEKFGGSLDAMNEFVISKLEKNDMPSRADYEKRQEMEELQNRYTNNFSIEDFLKVIPDPWTYFGNSDRNCFKYKLNSVIFLKSSFRRIYSRVITNTLVKNNFNLYLSYKELQQKNPNGRSRERSDSECNAQRPTKIDIQFLQEVAFIRNEEKIRDFIKTREMAKRLRFEEAKRTGNLLECQCCYDSEVMVEDIVYCPKDHSFCKPCLIKYVEVEMGQAKSQFPCLAGCGEKFTLTALQNVLKPELFSKIIQANQMEEIQAAGIEDLVQCPFCSYATIMPPEVKVLTCLNPECQKESCRLCKELSHIPLRCDEVERSEEVKMRTYIENKMTEALIRTCYKCGKAFVKEEGCNKMVCRCGAKMCYVCRKPVTSYSHFNGQGGTEYEKCPLYSTNDELHVDLVQRVAEEAKAEVLQANPDKELKHDPTMVLPERSYDRPLVGMNQGAAVAVGLLAFRQLRNPPGQQVAGQRPPAANNNIGNHGQQNRQRHHQNHRYQQPVVRQGLLNAQNRMNH